MNIQRKPDWLKKKNFYTPEKQKISNLFNQYNIKTICEEARCPNKSECYDQKTATFLIMGDICTRNCRFCSVKSASTKMVKEKLLLPPDPQEAIRIANVVKEMELDFVVITSVDRDDLDDFGVRYFLRTMRALRYVNPKIKIELLTPDFNGNIQYITQIVNEKPEIYNHNMETVERLSKKIRNKSDYFVSLSVLENIKKINPTMITKTGIMVGLGETESEVETLFQHLVNVNCDILTIGQYLQPTVRNIPVSEFITPDQFDFYKKKAESMGISTVYSGPFIRSSYKSAEAYEKILKQREQFNSTSP